MSFPEWRVGAFVDRPYLQLMNSSNKPLIKDERTEAVTKESLQNLQRYFLDMESPEGPSLPLQKREPPVFALERDVANPDDNGEDDLIFRMSFSPKECLLSLAEASRVNKNNTQKLPSATTLSGLKNSEFNKAAKSLSMAACKVLPSSLDCGALEEVSPSNRENVCPPKQVVGFVVPKYTTLGQKLGF